VSEAFMLLCGLRGSRFHGLLLQLHYYERAGVLDNLGGARYKHEGVNGSAII